VHGTHHPTVYRVDYACRCGGEHASVVSHEELDWAPLGVHDASTFVNLMTSRIDLVAPELSELAAMHIRAGEWPWSFWCWPEERSRVAFPSAFRLLAPAARGRRVAVAVCCPECHELSVNVVTAEHVDVPFVNDREVEVAEHLFTGDPEAQLAEFRAQLASDDFDARRLELG
jgi:hypothetical protein